MPRKVFVAGEILTAADVNANLMDQAVMVFDDSAARTTAIPSPIEGMVTYLKDSDQLFKYTTDWVPAGGLVETKTALKTNTFTSSVTAGNNVSVTDLSITHALQNASNKLLIMAFFGAAGSSFSRGNVGIAVADGGTLISIGATAGTRTSVTAGGVIAGSDSTANVAMPHIHVLYSPGDTASHTYDVRALNIATGTQTLFINRTENDPDNRLATRTVSAITIQEVAV